MINKKFVPFYVQVNSLNLSMYILEQDFDLIMSLIH
jgi:hypothetical protein